MTARTCARSSLRHAPLRWLTGLSYDAKDDVFSVISEELEHNVAHLLQINVDQELDALRSLEVVDDAGDHHIVTLKDPLRLPPGH